MLKKVRNDSTMNSFTYYPEDSSFSFILQKGAQYSFTASSGKINSPPVNVDVTTLNEFKDVYVDLYLTPAAMINAKERERTGCAPLTNIFKFFEARRTKEVYEEVCDIFICGKPGNI